MKGISLRTLARAANEGHEFQYLDGGVWLDCIDRHHAASLIRDKFKVRVKP